MPIHRKILKFVNAKKKKIKAIVLKQLPIFFFLTVDVRNQWMDTSFARPERANGGTTASFVCHMLPIRSTLANGHSITRIDLQIKTQNGFFSNVNGQ